MTCTADSGCCSEAISQVVWVTGKRCSSFDPLAHVGMATDCDSQCSGGSVVASGSNVRLEFQSDPICGGSSGCWYRQVMYAQAQVTVATATQLEITGEGSGEPGWENAKVSVGDTTHTTQISQGWANGCTMFSAVVDPIVLTIPPGTHLITFAADTNDGWFHTEAYFAFKINLAGGVECGSCICP